LPLSEALERVVMKMMHKDRARRYPQMSDVVADIDRLLAGDQNVGMPVVLSDESLRMRQAEPRQQRGAGFVAGGITLFVVVAAITALVAAKRRSAVAEIPSVPVAAAADAAPPPPHNVKVRLQSNTPCRVYNGEKEFASSGDVVPLPPGEPITLTCRAEGFGEVSHTIEPEDGLMVRFELKARPVEHVQKGGHGKPTTTKPPSSSQDPALDTLPSPYRKHQPDK
jgi:hypothetical protein